MSAAPVVWSAGYEAASLPGLIAALQAAGVSLVCDVRQLPLSRRAGFSKTMLAASLNEAGIAYRHFKALGTPKAGRTANREGRMDAFWEIVDHALAEPAALLAMEDLAQAAAEQPAVVLCYCGDESHCHRARVLDQLRARGFAVKALPL